MPRKTPTPKRPAPKTRLKAAHMPQRAKLLHVAYLWVMFGLAFGGLALNLPVAQARSLQKSGVLAYATSMSASGLLASTNQQRAAHAAADLQLNAKLNQAAQAKANDMAARDYWSHDTPEGNPPWVFITAAGYSYTAAGENLAYGFDTSAATVDGWMNSPGHKANLINTTYQEVGFGIANNANYQGTGPQTIVVAMYGRPNPPLAAAPAPAPPPPAPVPAPAPKPVVASSAPTPTPPPAAPAPTPEPTPAPAPATPAPAPAPAPSPEPAEPITPVAVQTQEKAITNAQLTFNGNLPWATFAVGFTSAASAVFLSLKHGFLLHKLIMKGEHFILHHPLLDLLLVSLVAFGTVFSQVAGHIH